MNQAAFAHPQETESFSEWHPEGYRIHPYDEGVAAVLQAEPSAMISARDGEWNTMLAQTGILLIGPAVWLLAGAFGYEGTARLAIALAVCLVLGGYAALELFLFSVRRQTRGHWRYNLLIDEAKVVGSPKHGETTIAKQDVAFFMIDRQRWALRPWLRYAVVGQLHDGRQIRLSPSVMRRRQAAEIAAVLNVWQRSPKVFVANVRRGSIWSALGLAWQ
jgi:hypothetical protein